MKTLHVTSSLSTGLDPGLAGVSTIQIHTPPIGEGGFGAVYRVSTIDGHAGTPRVLKVLFEPHARRGFDTIQELQRRLSAAGASCQSQGISLLRKYPALAGVPHLSVEGTLSGRPARAYVSDDLVAAGLEDFGGLLRDGARTRAFQSLPLRYRLRLALQLVDAFDFLSQHVRYIHADIKAEALFVDLNTPRCALIDFDSGAVARNAGDTPSTFGTKQDWLAPEILQQLDQPGNASRIVKVNLLSDVWSVNIAIHYLIFGFSPYFYLTEVSARSLGAYFSAYSWPDADPAFPYYRGDYAQLHRQYVRFVRHTLPKAVRERLAFTLGKGYANPASRTSYGQWRTVLGIEERPHIQQFTADRALVTDGRPVRLEWSATGASRLELSGVGDVSARSGVDVVVTRDTMFRLTLVPFVGAPLTRELFVEVSKDPPVVHRFSANLAALDRAVPARLTWQVSGAARLHIDGVGDVTGRWHADVLPRRDTTYTLTATSPFGITTTAQVALLVSTRAPVVQAFSADRTLLLNDPSVGLTWEVSDDAETVSISGVGRVARRGSTRVAQRADTEYVLRAVSYFGAAVEARVPVAVSKMPPRVACFASTTTFARQGQTLGLRWEVSGAAEVTIDPQVGPVRPNGAAAVTVHRDTCYTLSARTCFGVEVVRRVSVRVVSLTPPAVPAALGSPRTVLVRSTPLTTQVTARVVPGQLTRMRAQPPSLGLPIAAAGGGPGRKGVP